MCYFTTILMLSFFRRHKNSTFGVLIYVPCAVVFETVYAGLVGYSAEYNPLIDVYELRPSGVFGLYDVGVHWYGRSHVPNVVRDECGCCVAVGFQLLRAIVVVVVEADVLPLGVGEVS